MQLTGMIVLKTGNPRGNKILSKVYFILFTFRYDNSSQLFSWQLEIKKKSYPDDICLAEV